MYAIKLQLRALFRRRNYQFNFVPASKEANKNSLERRKSPISTSAPAANSPTQNRISTPRKLSSKTGECELKFYYGIQNKPEYPQLDCQQFSCLASKKTPEIVGTYFNNGIQTCRKQSTSKGIFEFFKQMLQSKETFQYFIRKL